MIYRNTYNLVVAKINEIQDEIRQNSKDIKRAADFGDLKENAEYHAAKDNQAHLHNKRHASLCQLGAGGDSGGAGCASAGRERRCRIPLRRA